jgi:hypothetical protein
MNLSVNETIYWFVLHRTCVAFSENGRIMGSVTGVQTASVADKIWLIFQALGDVAFSYPYSILLLEIQDTLESPPPENQTMKKVSTLPSFSISCYFCPSFGSQNHNK